MFHSASNLLTTALLGLVLLLGGCQSTGHIRYERHSVQSDGTPLVQRVEVTTPRNPVVPGLVQFDSEGVSTVSTGNEAKLSASAKSLAKLTWLGGLLLAAGVVALLLKSKLPLIPLEIGLGLAISGVLLMILPSLIEAYLGYILLGLVGAAVLATIWRLNRLSA